MSVGQEINKSYDELIQLKIIQKLLPKCDYRIIKNIGIPHKRINIDKEDNYQYLLYKACKKMKYRTLEQINVDIQKCQQQLFNLFIDIDIIAKEVKITKHELSKTRILKMNKKYEDIKTDIITRILKYGQKSFWIDQDTLNQKQNIYTKVNNHWVLTGQCNLFERHKDLYIDFQYQRVFLLNHNFNDLYPYVKNKKLHIKSDKFGYIQIKTHDNRIMYVDVLYRNKIFRPWTGKSSVFLYYDDEQHKQHKHILLEYKQKPMNLLKEVKHKPSKWETRYINLNRVDCIV